MPSDDLDHTRSPCVPRPRTKYSRWSRWFPILPPPFQFALYAMICVQTFTRNPTLVLRPMHTILTEIRGGASPDSKSFDKSASSDETPSSTPNIRRTTSCATISASTKPPSRPVVVKSQSCPRNAHLGRISQSWKDTKPKRTLKSRENTKVKGEHQSQGRTPKSREHRAEEISGLREHPKQI
jgi:hypothetical protein